MYGMIFQPTLSTAGHYSHLREQSVSLICLNISLAFTNNSIQFIIIVSFTNLALAYVCIFDCSIMCFLCHIVYSLYYFYQRPL